MGTAHHVTYFKGEDKEAIVRELEQMKEDSLYEDGHRYDQGEWGGVYIDRNIFVHQEPIRFDDLSQDEEMSKIQHKGDCRAVPVLAPEWYTGYYDNPHGGISLTYETTVTAEEVEQLDCHRRTGGYGMTPLLEDLRDSILDAIDGETVEIERVKRDRDVHNRHTAKHVTTEKVVYSRDDWNTHEVIPDLSTARTAKKTKGKRVTKYAVVVEERFRNTMSRYATVKQYGVFDTEKEAMTFIVENEKLFRGEVPEVQGIVKREDDQPLAKAVSKDAVVSVKIALSPRLPESELVKGYAVFAKSAS